MKDISMQSIVVSTGVDIYNKIDWVELKYIINGNVQTLTIPLKTGMSKLFELDQRVDIKLILKDEVTE